MSSSRASSASFFRASAKVFRQYASSLIEVVLSSAGATLLLLSVAAAFVLSSVGGVLVLSCVVVVLSAGGAGVSPTTLIVPLTVSMLSFVKTVTGLADDFFSACALRAAAATLSWARSAVNKLGENTSALTIVANRTRFGFMVIRRLSGGSGRSFKSGGLLVADAPLVRQSSAASGKPALWRRRREPMPVSRRKPIEAPRFLESTNAFPALLDGQGTI